jgi:hypothetical protein
MSRIAHCLFLASLSLSLFAAGHDLRTAPPSGYQVRPVVTGNGSGFAAAWVEPAQTRPSVVSSVVNADGEPIAGAGNAIDQTSVQSMAIAHSPSETLVVWIADGDVFAERLSPSGMSINTIPATFGKGYKRDVAVAWNGSRYFVVWSNGAQLFGAFVESDGYSTVPQPFFSEPNAAEMPVAPDLAWDGHHFIVVFGEVPNIICSTLCAEPDPDQFRVMRVSADGGAIDSSPVMIAGRHLRAHVAASGSESLITLDSFGEVSTILAHDNGGLMLDAETPIFRWYSDVSSAVVWDGTTYTVGWRYLGGDLSWIGAAHVTRSGLRFDYRVTAAGLFPSVWWGRPSMAANDNGVTAFVVSEAAVPSSVMRARLYFASELAPMPPPPPAPMNAVSYFGGNTARIDWQSETAAGFEIEESWDFGKNWYLYRIMPGDARTTTVYASVGNLFRVRAFGPGGVSEGAITSIGSMQRHRALHP